MEATVRQSYAAEERSVPMARLLVRNVLVDQPREVAERAALLTTELAANAVRYGRGQEFSVAISTDGTIRVEVSDLGTDLPVARGGDPWREGGRGLQIVSRLADSWGVTRGEGGAGKTVWFELRPRPAERTLTLG